MKEWILLAALMFPTAALGETIICIPEASGGIKFIQGEWRGVSFKGENSQYVISSKDNNHELYDVKEVGKNYRMFGCIRGKGSNGAPLDKMDCGDMRWGMIFDFNSMRYSEIYTFGYLENDTSGKNTPLISGGKCSSISID